MKTQNQITHYLYLASILFACQTTAFANGFRLPEYSAAGVATSNALVADDSRISAIAYNPAIMAIYSSSNKKNTSLFSGNAVHIDYETEVSTSTKTTQGTGESKFDIPSLFVSNQISDKLSIGMLIHSPFGLETAWPTNTFAPFGGSAALEPDLSRIKMYNVNFNLGYRLSTNTGIAIGFNKYNLLDLRLNSQATEIKGSGIGYGWNAALISKLTSDISLGVSYRSAVHAQAQGAAAGVLPIEVDVTFPEMLTIGLNYKVNDALKFELDIEHTGWKVFDNLNIRNRTNDSTVTSSTNNWDDTLTYSFSGQFKSHQHQFLFGYAYDETPQGDAKYSARIPDSDRQRFSIGYQYDLGTYQLETGLMLIKFDDRTVNSSTTYVPASPPNEPNGTTAYNGTYRASATLFSVGISTTF